MSALVDKIKDHPQIFHSMRCEMVRVWDCEDKLNLTFPEEFTQYLTHFGAIGFGAVEWTGMNVEADLNVVRATLAARKTWTDFPSDCFVLRPASEQGGEMILCDEQENIYVWKPEGDPGAGTADNEHTEKMTKVPVCTGLAAYFELCLAEAKI